MSQLAEKLPEVRVVDDLSNDDYHALPSFSSSQIKDAINHPMAYFKAKYIDKILPRIESSAMSLGSAVHSAWMEPDLFASEFAIAPACDKRTKIGKETWAAFVASAEGKAVITEKDGVEVSKMCQALNANKTAKALLGNCLVEKSVFWTDVETGLDLRVRPDIWREKTYLADLKSTQDASLAGFQGSVYKFGYHISAALYLDAMKELGQPMDDFIFICVESKAPYLTAVYTLSEEAIDVGRREYKGALKRISECLRADKWLGYNDDEVAEISLPQYILNREI